MQWGGGGWHSRNVNSQALRLQLVRVPCFPHLLPKQILPPNLTGVVRGG